MDDKVGPVLLGIRKGEILKLICNRVTAQEIEAFAFWAIPKALDGNDVYPLNRCVKFLRDSTHCSIIKKH